MGSALNVLSKRIERHISKKKKKHWHVDYLLLNKNADIKKVIYTYCTEKIECEISHHISEKAENYIEDFGCSDCNCESHLYYFNTYDDAMKSSFESYEKMKYNAYEWLN